MRFTVTSNDLLQQLLTVANVIINKKITEKNLLEKKLIYQKMNNQ